MPKDNKKVVVTIVREARRIAQRQERIVSKQRLARLAYESGQVNWENIRERLLFLDSLVYSLINELEGAFPYLREILSSNKIERLLWDSVPDLYERETGGKERFIEIAIQSGYKNEPELDEAGKPVLLRDTALLEAARNDHENYVRSLFKVYDRFDVNYTDESGYTHFHAACRYGCEEAIEKFLELGQDPNLLLDKTDEDVEVTYKGIELGCRPLHLALYNEYRTKEVIELLLRNGADPNMKMERRDGNAPLHLICVMGDVELLDAFFKINDELGNEVEVDQKNVEDWTPLQVAILYYHTDVAVYLLKNRKADPSKVSCPYEKSFWDEHNDEFYLKAVSGRLTVVDTLEKYGYEMNRSQLAEDIKEDFDTNELLEKLDDLAENWYCCEDFRREAEQIIVKTDLSLYRLVQLPYDEAKELVTCMDFWEFARSDKLNQLPQRYRKNCAVHLIKTMSQGFF